RPGAFCVVAVPVGDAREAIVVPTLAVQPTERGSVVYVIDDKNVARQKVVQLGMHTPDGNVELTSGVAPGDTIVVRGIEPLSDGAPVKVTDHVSLDADAGAPGPATSSAPSAAPAAPSAAPAASSASAKA